MLYKDIVTSMYTKLLGRVLKKQLTAAHILQNQIGYDDSDGEVILLSETTVGQILKGNRNMSYNATLAFQSTLNYRTPKILFLQDDSFKIQLLTRLVTLILTDSNFNNTLLRQTLNQKIGRFSEKNIQNFIQSHKKIFLTSLSNFFPDFLEEETSFEVAEKLADWLSEFACLISQL
ncbi:hypothetical protein BA718_11160 [Streptococcus gallolyticus subsp. gallolyticus]|uniref:Uncharacterized protein n=2 Tax=Streptococcus gallolyticus TaxID=315405 RepID=A0AA36K007_STRG3|nr:hypothetical protein [Streptococcus gallolyticus]KJE98867.1 hypothetical protein UG96_11155 [Streptococcus gallolyticus subsp. gallolyticus]MBE6164197.1 hypothetical protein [Streptococcus gallolyticus]MCY7157344.1 hypothetical protein [Streptococcus gallolyticus subsp. gallolyticus]MCY7178092.1 hypothetical protein [Streptococcus gallolyticus subsp. gallolyticus]OAV82004.1 hypothetical protein A3651_11130 [Streptococcus gallolyticus subsp. gallolyticus]